MLDITYKNFIKLLSNNLNIENIINENINVKKSIDNIKNGSKIYIWPYGKMGKTVCKELKKNGYENITLVDKSDKIQGVSSPDDIKFGEDEVLIITTLTHSKYIYNLAKNMNCKNIIMYYNVKELGKISPIVFPEDFYDKCFEELTIHLLENIERYKNMYFSLADELSKKAFLNNMFFRLTHDIRYTFEEDKEIQYFDSSIVNFNPESVLVDCGGCNGDTLEQFLKLNKAFKAYYLFEPDEDLLNQAKMVTNDKRISFINKGVFSKECTLSFNKTENMIGDGKISEDGGYLIEVTSIDKYFDERIDFIKMDIEGSELEALIGSKNIISKYSPNLAICIYHKPTDYLDIFEYIKNLNQNYKFFIRHHRDFYAEAVLYAVLEKEIR